MIRNTWLIVLFAACCLPQTLFAGETKGFYLESRTCQVYTGPCFANAEVGLSGRNAIMAWSIEEGQQEGVSLKGLNVVMLLDASQTLGFRGIDGPRQLKSVILVDQRADPQQRQALVNFAKKHAGRAGQYVVRIDTAPINMSLDKDELRGSLEAGKTLKLTTRKARPDDCICSNESAYYPPLVKLKTFVPGVTIEGYYKGRGLGSRWSTPGDRSSYMATFVY